MDNFLNKCDTELQIIYANYRSFIDGKKEIISHVHPAARGRGRLSVLLRFDNNILPIENLGFKITHLKDDHTAQGSLRLSDIEAIASHQHVLSLSAGSPGKTMLDESVTDLNARGTGKVWQVNRANGSFSGLATGEGVVIGIIDTGIDWTHPVFRSSDSPITTRIRRIWDPGIDPHDTAQSPQTQYMEGSERYGVEYTDTMINQVLRGNASSSTIKHKDCGAHGTHVASTAAGDGRAARPGWTDSEYKYIGVAPKADIVVVKILDLFKPYPETEPEPGETNGTYILFDQMFKDAVTYILKVAELDLGDKPVVINYSIGSSMVAHDGFTEQEEWLTQKFGAPDSKGLFCTSAGNDRGDEKHAIATIPASGEISIDFELYDDGDTRMSFDTCKNAVDTSSLAIGMWYTQPLGQAVLPHLKLSRESNEAEGLAVSATIQHGYFGNNDQYHHTFIHSTKTFIKPPTGPHPATTVTRNKIYLELAPTIRGHFVIGIYRVRITGPEDLKIHIWVEKSNRGYYGINYPAEVPGELDIHDTHLIGRPGGANNILTVASYDTNDGTISTFSSPGPLKDYSPHEIPYTNKPDITAPGSDSGLFIDPVTEFMYVDQIRAAESSHSNPPSSSPCLQETAPHNYVGFRGTSMASPHIAGVAALILEKNNNLTTSQLIALIKNNVQPGSAIGANDWGAGKVDAKLAIDNTPTP